MVAPRGNVKLEILFETPLFSFTQLIVKESVAPDDDVENAVSNALLIARK